MAITQKDLATQMLAQLRLLDPSVSAEVGTPERKILDTVAQALSDAQVDLVQLSGALDVDSKVGTNLDKFLALFGFGRQEPTRATGYVQFGREDFAPSNLDIRIPVGTQITLDPTKNTDTTTVNSSIYETTFEATLPANQLTVLVPIRALLPGSAGNLEAGRFFQFAGAYVFGLTNIHNDAPITGGIDVEDDDVLKVRFKNTVFRNLAGTQDQYMALAAATAYTTKVNVVGPISRYREYIQVPSVDDASSVDIDPPPPGGSGAADPGNGNPNEWTSALSTIPYSKHTYDTVPNFVSNGKPGTQVMFYREGIDWRLNTSPAAKNRGDAYREANAQFPEDISPLDPLANRDSSVPFDAPGSARPNVTFLNVYTGTDSSVVGIRKRDIVLFEHSYMSTASRNNYDRNISNAIDVFIDGQNNTISNTLVPRPIGVGNTFNTDVATKYYNQNYRRYGEPDLVPTVGNYFIPLFWQPVTALPDEITVKSTDGTLSATFYQGVHYWLVEDISELYGTVRARNGIEWDPNINGGATSVDRSGPKLLDFPSGTPIPISNYTFDKNIVDLQSAFEQQKQVTTDVLAHRARIRYFKLDITVMYSPGSYDLFVNEQIRAAVDRYFSTQYFGNVIQLSDLLSTIHSVTGVDNVRWSSDVFGSSDINRVYETNLHGTNRPSTANPLVPKSFNNDFFLRDDELPALAQDIDTVGFNGGLSDQQRSLSREFAVQFGLIIRSRAQNTWINS